MRYRIRLSSMAEEHLEYWRRCGQPSVLRKLATTNVCRPGIGNKEVNLIMIAPLHKDITTMKQYK